MFILVFVSSSIRFTAPFCKPGLDFNFTFGSIKYGQFKDYTSNCQAAGTRDGASAMLLLALTSLCWSLQVGGEELRPSIQQNASPNGYHGLQVQ